MKKNPLMGFVLWKNERWKLFLVMRLVIVFLFCFMLGGYASSNAQYRLNVKMGETTFDELFQEIRKQTGCIVVYNSDVLDKNAKVEANFGGIELTELLEKVLTGKGLIFEINKEFVILMKAPQKTEEQKKITITGIVKDKRGERLIGVTVLVKGTSIGVVTDTLGKYKITLPERKDLVLVYSFIGMQSKEVKVTDLREVNVVLEEEKVNLEDVVVTGYATVKKSSFTGNSVKVNKEDILKVSSSNVVDVLQVFDPSLRIMRNNEMGSDPNTLPEFYIRGRSGIGVMELDKGDLSKSALSNNPNAPVFIMDGFEVTMEKVYDLDPNRIESITILKDAAATAMYGSRGANGVVVIETVAPKAGRLQVDYSFNGALTVPDLSDYNLMNASEKLEAERLAGLFESDDIDKYYTLQSEYLSKLNNVLKGVNTDWISQPLRNEVNHKHSLYVVGGSENIRFGVDLKYDNQNGVMKGSVRNRKGAGLSLDYRIGDFQIRNYITYDVVKAKNSPYGVFSDYTKKLPYDPMKDEEGNWLKATKFWHSAATNYDNPLYEAELLKSFDKNGYDELMNNLSLNWYGASGLQVKGQFSVTKRDYWTKTFVDPLSAKFGDESETLRGSLTESTTKELSMNLNLLFTYVKTIDKHSMNLTLGLNTVENKRSYFTASYLGFPSGTLNTPSYAEQIVSKPGVSDNHTRLFGSFATLNYTYNNVYLLDASFRLDGSSEFGTDKKYAPFYSIGVGMNIHNYEFMKTQEIVSQLRLTATHGQLGKTNFPPYAAKHTYGVSDNYYITGNGIYLYYMGNDKLKWEKTISNEVKLDLGFMQDAILLKAAWYDKKTVDLITDVTLPASTGFTVYKDNLGEVRNRGFELDVKAVLYKSNDMYVSVFGNLAHNRNKILKISESLKAYNDRVDEKYEGYNESVFSQQDPQYSKPFMKYVEGGSLTSIFGMKSFGINPSDGQELYLKRDGTVTSEWESREQVILGDMEADAQGAFGLNVQYKSFALFTSFLYEFGGQAYNSTLVEKVENVDVYNMNADKRVLTERWQKPGDVTRLKAIQDRSLTTRPTSRFVQNYNVLNFNSLTVQYDFNTSLVSKIGLSMLRLSFNMKDIANFSSVKQERGLSYPYARTFNFTLNASF
uniref:SusC/RagA family TonB-linked outer membrane protein n=2 Tax=Butyricimonas synergistica TaxID=544644 RepID=UPI00039D5093|nr:SusC/RagA family TonB-linked outer membrane protein [Butyricimonas synergistica]